MGVAGLVCSRADGNELRFIPNHVEILKENIFYPGFYNWNKDFKETTEIFR